MDLKNCLQYDAMHLIAGNVKSINFVMMGLLPAKPKAVVLQYDQQVNGRDISLMRLSELTETCDCDCLLCELRSVAQTDSNRKLVSNAICDAKCCEAQD